tara:strand:- start:1567 stop:2547 length:981 start_codon:yes stop_codon:yes gene_type:complete
MLVNYNEEKITVIIPVYNNISYIKKTIASVINQNYKNWKIIISDDNSKDGSREYLKSIKNKKIKIFYQKKNLGIFGNFKFLNSKVSNSIVKILCADDYLYKNCLSKINSFMQKNKSCKILTVFPFIKNHFTSEHLFKKICSNNVSNLNPKSSMVALLCFGNVFGNISRVTYRKDDEINFNPNFIYGGDFDIWSRYSMKYGLYILHERLLFVRIHKFQSSNILNKNGILYLELSKIYKFLLTHVEKKYHTKLKICMIINIFGQRITRYLKSIIFNDKLMKKRIFNQLPLKINYFQIFFFNFFFYGKTNWFKKIYLKKMIKIINDMND